MAWILRSYWLLLVIPAVATFIAGCSSPETTQPEPSQTSTGNAKSDQPETPAEVVVAYYTFLGQHDTEAAAALLASEIRESQRTTPDSDFTNVSHLDNIRNISEDQEPSPNKDVPDSYQDIALVTLTYDVEYKEIITDESGTTTRFVYVGRESDAAPWRIVSIGTGP
jgi:hypothetical protein